VSNRATSAALVFLNGEKKRVKDSLNIIEQNLQYFMDQHQLVQVNTQANELIDRISGLKQKLQSNRIKLATAKSGIAQYQQQLDSIKPGLADEFANVLGGGIARMQRELAEIKFKKAKILTRNPGLKNKADPPLQLRRLNRKIKDYQNKIRSKVQAQLNKNEQFISMTGLSGNNTVMNDIYNLQKKVINLKVKRQQYQLQNNIQKKELNKLNASFDNLPANIIALARLKRNKKAEEQLYLTVNQMQTKQLLKKKTQFGRGQIINRGSVPGMPVAPNKRAYLLFGFIIGCLLGAGFVIVRDTFDNTIDSSILHKKFNENVPDIPLLAVIPELKKYIPKGQKVGTMIGQNGEN
jgi:uncharacterized protein involved in exopolysaccharide biosynthesis